MLIRRVSASKQLYPCRQNFNQIQYIAANTTYDAEKLAFHCADIEIHYSISHPFHPLFLIGVIS